MRFSNGDRAGAGLLRLIGWRQALEVGPVLAASREPAS